MTLMVPGATWTSRPLLRRCTSVSRGFVGPISAACSTLCARSPSWRTSDARPSERDLRVTRVIAHMNEGTQDYDWTREEVVLALDLYVQSDSTHGRPLLGPKSEAVVRLSQLLRSLGIHPTAGRKPAFRNVNSVGRKLANLRA